MKEIRVEVLKMLIANGGYGPTYEQLTYLKCKYSLTTTAVINVFDYFKYSKQGQARVAKALV